MKESGKDHRGVECKQDHVRGADLQSVQNQLLRKEKLLQAKQLRRKEAAGERQVSRGDQRLLVKGLGALGPKPLPLHARPQVLLARLRRK